SAQPDGGTLGLGAQTAATLPPGQDLSVLISTAAPRIPDSLLLVGQGVMTQLVWNGEQFAPQGLPLAPASSSADSVAAGSFLGISSLLDHASTINPLRGAPPIDL